MKNKTQVKQGYKFTKLGWIPEDWEVIELGDIFEYINTPSFSRDNLTYEKTEKEINYIHYGDIHSNYKSVFLDFEIETKIPFLRDEFCSENFKFLKEGDLVIADASEDYKGIGESIEIKNIKNKKAIGGLHTIVLRDKTMKTTNGFRTYLLRNFKVHSEIKKIATGISVYGISKGNLSKVNITLPPLTEQKSIAACLLNWDKSIQNLSQLIEQKEIVKKWLMRQLLTGKKRLPGFSEVWGKVGAGDVFKSVTVKGYSDEELLSATQDRGIIPRNMLE
ncbi:MAG: restriction endonuclease subunit S, partial [Bacteroidales bacterium]|nr:restriction endonuclease subunit S [Bacteroidales bacterium]